MKDIFTDLYKKVAGFFQAQEKEDNAKDVAVNRMKLVLMQDRTNLTPFLLEKMRGEMIAVLAKYVEMDQEALELNFEQEGEQMALMLSIPVLRAKEEDEIQAALDAEAKAKEEAEETCTCGCQNGDGVEECTCEECECAESAEDVEETDEDLTEVVEEEVCAGALENEESEEISESPDESNQEEPSSKKSKKK
jgi:cell division topological specificity factor